MAEAERAPKILFKNFLFIGMVTSSIMTGDGNVWDVVVVLFLFIPALALSLWLKSIFPKRVGQKGTPEIIAATFVIAFNIFSWMFGLHIPFHWWTPFALLWMTFFLLALLMFASWIINQGAKQFQPRAMIGYALALRQNAGRFALSRRADASKFRNLLAMDGYLDAEPLDRENLSAAIAEWGQVNIHTAASLDKLADTLWDKNRREEAANLYTKALMIRRELAMPEHLDEFLIENKLRMLDRSVH